MFSRIVAAAQPADVVRLDRDVEDAFLTQLEQRCQRDRRVATANQRRSVQQQQQQQPPAVEACERLDAYIRKRRATS